MAKTNLNTLLIEWGLSPVLPGAVFSFRANDGVTRYVSTSKRSSPFWIQDSKNVEVIVTKHGTPQRVFKTRVEDIQVVSRFATKKMSRLFMRQQPTREYTAKQDMFYDRAYYWAREFKQSCDLQVYLEICYKTSMAKAWMDKLEEGDKRLGNIRVKPHTRTFNRLCGSSWWVPRAMVPLPKGVDRDVYNVLAEEVYEEHSRKFNTASRFFKATVEYLESLTPEDFTRGCESVTAEFWEACRVLEAFENAISFYEA